MSQRAVLAARQGSQDCIKHTVKILRNCFSKESQHTPGSTLVSSALNRGICGKWCAETSAAGTVDVLKTKALALELRTVPKSVTESKQRVRKTPLEKH